MDLLNWRTNMLSVDRCPDREEGQEVILWYKHDPYNAPKNLHAQRKRR